MRLRCRYGRGEGFVALVMAPSSPTHKGENVVVLGSVVNQDGRSSSLTAPNGPSQAVLIKEALKAADVAPSSLVQVAMHGTGTPLGDPIEVNALGQVFSGDADQRTPLTLGSAKSCFGHTEATAGLTGGACSMHLDVYYMLVFVCVNVCVRSDELVALQVSSRPPWPWCRPRMLQCSAVATSTPTLPPYLVIGSFLPNLNQPSTGALHQQHRHRNKFLRAALLA
jgi:Beta-ketoacyl synthase, C-terminal domain